MTRRGFAGLLAFAAPAGLVPPAAAAAVPRDNEPDLKHQPPAHQVRRVVLCDDVYRVTTADGRTRPFLERNLRFKTDRSARGPRSGVPVILPAGMRGDRVLVIFSRPEELASVVEHAR